MSTYSAPIIQQKKLLQKHLQTCHTCEHNFNENQFYILKGGYNMLTKCKSFADAFIIQTIMW